MTSSIPKFKVCVIGPSAVGKTAIIMRYVYNRSPIDEHSATVSTYTYTKQIEPNGIRALLEISDTPGQEKVAQISNSFYTNADGFLLVYDVSDDSSLNKIETHYNTIRENTNNLPGLLVCNKIDLKSDRTKSFVSKPKAQQWASANNLTFVETSALDDYNITVSDAFLELNKLILTRRQEKEKEKQEKLAEQSNIDDQRTNQDDGDKIKSSTTQKNPCTIQ